MPQSIQYSDKYFDDVYEYRFIFYLWSLFTNPTIFRHVILPSDVSKSAPKGRLMTESEWRNLGVQQSRGWEHYAVHKPEPHVLLFRRLLDSSPNPPVGSIKNPSADVLAQWKAQQQLEAQMQQ